MKEKNIDHLQENMKYSEFSLTGEVARYLNISCILTARILRESVDGLSVILDAVNCYNAILDDYIIPTVFHALFEITSELKTEDRELVLLHEPKDAGYYEFSAKEDLVLTNRYPGFTPEQINREVVLLPYILGTESKLQKTIYFQESWIEMIQDHTVAILGWIQYEKVKWLQNNNPEVPGLVHKLAPMDEKMRKLNNVRKLWEGILDISEVRDVFTGQPVMPRQYDVDHFIPWSFVMNDELWNLAPMDSALNSAKSNRLPRWEPFFKHFAENQFLMYGLIHEKAGIRKLYEACYRDNLHSLWAGQELYRKGNTKEEFYHILQKNMRPVYDSAKRQGYEVWNRN